MPYFLLLIISLLLSYRAVAWETDQYTLSATPIAETGEEVSRFIHKKLQSSLDLANYYRITYPSKIKQIEVKLSLEIKLFNDAKRASSYNQMAMLEQEIRLLRQVLKTYKDDFKLTQSQQGLSAIVAKTLGGAIAKEEKKDAIWKDITGITPYPTGMKDNQSISFSPKRFDSIYAYAGFHRILHPSHFIFSSTIKLFDIEIGLDKLGHIFNEGFQYYRKFNHAKNLGESDQVALNKGIAWGVDTENSYYGRWVSGIYSNADLASNYVGLHFYFNLFAPLEINGLTYPAILLQNKQGDYDFNPEPQNQPQRLLKRFISYHMNEAFNPSSLEYLQYIVVKKAVKNRCESWKNKHLEPAILKNKSSNLTRWNGKYYGFNAHNTVSIYDSCFASSSI
jgi:hypothetical protein